jgi:hypothetical protein
MRRDRYRKALEQAESDTKKLDRGEAVCGICFRLSEDRHAEGCPFAALDAVSSLGNFGNPHTGATCDKCGATPVEWDGTGWHCERHCLHSERYQEQRRADLVELIAKAMVWWEQQPKRVWEELPERSKNRWRERARAFLQEDKG